MKKILFILCLFFNFVWAQAQEINIELWDDNKPVVFQCHVVGDAGSYGKMTSDLQLEFWATDDDSIDMRQSYDVVYTRANPKSGAYIYHGKREGNKIIFDSFEDGDAMEGSEEPTQIDKSFMPFEAVITSPTTITWDKCTYRKMVFDLTNGEWKPAN